MRFQSQFHMREKNQRETMKQRSSKSPVSASAADVLNDEDIEVAAILFDFPNIISISNYKSKSSSDDEDFTRLLRLHSISWGSKSRRSARFQSSPALVNVNQTEKKRRRPPTIDIKVEAAESPLTPLCFPQSESDDKSKEQEHFILILNSTTLSKKRKKKEWMEMIDELTQQKEVLTGELQNVKNLYSRLKAFNLELKSKKQKLGSITCHERVKPNLEMQKSLNLGPTGLNPSSYYHQQISLFAQQHQQFIMLDRHHHHHHHHHQSGATAYESSQQQQQQQYRGIFLQQDPYGQRAPLLGSGTVNNQVQVKGPIEETFVGIDPSQPLDGSLSSKAFLFADSKRLRFSELRHIRRLKLREKKRLAVIKLQRRR